MLHIILDNVLFHGKAEVLFYMATHEIKFCRTLINASWLNRVEGHITGMKKCTLNNADYRSHDEQQAAIDRYFNWHNGTREISLKNRKAYRRTPKKVA